MAKVILLYQERAQHGSKELSVYPATEAGIKQMATHLRFNYRSWALRYDILQGTLPKSAIDMLSEQIKGSGVRIQ